MSRRIQKKISKSNDDALVVFVARKTEIDAMLKRIQSFSDDHFGAVPDEVTWGHVGPLGHYAELLRRITEMAFREGEHAA